MWSTVRLGNNVIHGDPVARTLLVVGGSRLLDAERRGDLLVVGADVYDDHGRRIGQFAANRWTAPTPAFILCEPGRIVVEDVRDSTVLLDVRATETQLVVSAMRLGTRDGRFCVLDERGGLTLHYRRGIGSAQYIIGDSASTTLGRIDLASTFAQPPSAVVAAPWGSVDRRSGPRRDLSPGSRR